MFVDDLCRGEIFIHSPNAGRERERENRRQDYRITFHHHFSSGGLSDSHESGQSGQFALPSRRDFHSFRASRRDMKAPLLIGGSLKEAGEPDGSPVGKFRLKMTTRRSVLAPSG